MIAASASSMSGVITGSASSRSRASASCGRMCRAAVRAAAYAVCGSRTSRLASCTDARWYRSSAEQLIFLREQQLRVPLGCGVLGREARVARRVGRDDPAQLALERRPVARGDGPALGVLDARPPVVRPELERALELL